MRTLLIVIATWLILVCCQQKRKSKTELLSADREAPLGWVYLKLYSDSSFEFISAGLRNQNKYPGKFKFHNDTLQLEYSDSIPPLKAKTAILISNTIVFIDGSYPEALAIKINKLKEN